MVINFAAVIIHFAVLVIYFAEVFIEYLDVIRSAIFWLSGAQNCTRYIVSNYNPASDVCMYVCIVYRVC